MNQSINVNSRLFTSQLKFWLLTLLILQNRYRTVLILGRLVQVQTSRFEADSRLIEIELQNP